MVEQNDYAVCWIGATSIFLVMDGMLRDRARGRKGLLRMRRERGRTSPQRGNERLVTIPGAARGDKRTTAPGRGAPALVPIGEVWS